MKHIFKLTTGLVLGSIVFAIAQTGSGAEMVALADTLVTSPDSGISQGTYDSLNSFIAGINWIYGGLVVIAGYVSSFVPGLKKIDTGVYRVGAVAIVLGLGFYYGAGASLLNLFLTYTVSTSFYEVILKLLKKSPTPAEAASIMTSFSKKD